MQDKKDFIRKIKQVDISTKAVVEGLQCGYHNSVFKGHGMEFTDIREYTAGDDIRAIDWNVTARLNHPYVKEFTEERDQTFYFVLDYSGSGNFGSDTSKFEKMLEIAASLMFAAVRNNDRIGLCIFTEKVEKYIPAKAGRKHVISIINEMIDHKPRHTGTDLSAALRYLSGVVKRRASFIIISDFYSPGFEKPLCVLKARRHEVMAVRVTDRRESELPDVGFIELEDCETGEQVFVDTSDEIFRKNYCELCSQADEKIIMSLKKCRTDVVSLDTSESYINPLKAFFKGDTGRGDI